MRIPLTTREDWGLPYNRTPDSKIDGRGFGGHPRERGSSPPMVSAIGRRWRAVAVGVAIGASLTSGLAAGEEVHETGRQTTSVADHTFTVSPISRPGNRVGGVKVG